MKRLMMIAVLTMIAVSAADARQGGAPPSGKPPAKDEKPVSVTGAWAVALTMTMGTSTPLVTLKQEGEKLTGTYQGRYGSFPLEGTLKGRAIEFWFTMSVESEKVEMSFKGEVSPDGTAMRGAADLGQAGEGTWTAQREKWPLP